MVNRIILAGLLLGTEVFASPAGYRCTAERRDWIQATPCPGSRTRHESTSVHGVDNRGNAFNGSTSVPVAGAVRQEELDHDAFCSLLSQGEPIGERRMGSSDESYERNKLRNAEGCGR